MANPLGIVARLTRPLRDTASDYFEKFDSIMKSGHMENILSQVSKNNKAVSKIKIQFTKKRIQHIKDVDKLIQTLKKDRRSYQIIRRTKKGRKIPGSFNSNLILPACVSISCNSACNFSGEISPSNLITAFIKFSPYFLYAFAAATPIAFM